MRRLISHCFALIRQPVKLSLDERLAHMHSYKKCCASAEISKILLAGFRKIYACNDFSTQFRCIKIGYNTNVIRQTACTLVNPITVNNFASLFGCTPAGRASDSMTAPAERLLSKSVDARCSGSGRAHRSPTVGFLLFQHFSYFLLSSTYRCFISAFV